MQVALGKALVQCGQYDQAEQHLLAAYRVMRAKLGERHPRTVGALALLAQLYGEMGKPDEADEYRARLATASTTAPTTTAPTTQRAALP